MNIQLLNPLRWKKSFLALVLCSFVVVWFSFIDTYSLKTRWELHNKKEKLKQQTQRLNKESLKLDTQIKLLNNDPFLLEKIAREEYGMRKPGETVYKIKREN